MNFVFSAEGFKALRGAWLVLVLACIVSALFAFASTWYLDRDKKGTLALGKRVQEARARLDSARREKDNLQESSEVFRTLLARGLFEPEQRLNLVEMVNSLRVRHQLFALDYELLAQRPLVLPGGHSFNSVDVLASRMKFKARGLHEGDVLAFINSLTAGPQGLYPVDRCLLKRLEQAESPTLLARVEADCSVEWITLKEKRVSP